MVYRPRQYGSKPRFSNPVYRPQQDRYRDYDSSDFIDAMQNAERNIGTPKFQELNTLAYRYPKRSTPSPQNKTFDPYKHQGFKEINTPEDQYNFYKSFSNLVSDTDYEENPLPKYDYLEQAENMLLKAGRVRQRASQLRFRRALEALQSNYSVPDVNIRGRFDTSVAGRRGGGGGSSRGFMAFKRAISGQESGGNYGAVNPDSGAMGKYQIIPSNIAGSGGWDKEALGRNISTSQFLSSPRLQEAIATYKLRQYYRKYGPRGAASAWYSGDPNKWRDSSPQGGYPSIAAYVRQIMARMGR